MLLDKEHTFIAKPCEAQGRVARQKMNNEQTLRYAYLFF